MWLITGGFGQGKLSYALEQLTEVQKERLLLLDETFRSSEEKDRSPSAVIINHLHLILKAFQDPGEADLWLNERIRRAEEQGILLLILTDELGCGIVPAQKEDREWREHVGRTVCDLARKAQRVDRLVCGISQRLK